MLRFAGCVIAGAMALGAAVPASADTIFDDIRSKGLTVTVGAAFPVSPKFEGSDTYVFAPGPLLNIRPIGAPPRFFTPKESFGVTVFEFGGWQFGPAVAVERIRKVKNEPMYLSEFDKSTVAVEVGMFAEYWFAKWVRYRTELRQGVTEGQGFINDHAIDFVAPFGAWMLSAGPRLRIVDAKANSRSFDVTAQQSLTSGLATYDAGGGIRSVGGGVQALYRFNPQWAIYTFAEYDRLVSDAHNSSYVAARGSSDIWLVGSGFQFSFDWVR